MPEKPTKISDEEFAAFVPHCRVCGVLVPPERFRGKSRVITCSDEHQRMLRRWRRWKVQNAHCPSCKHPSTPEERKLFIEWRKSITRSEGRFAGRPPVRRNQACRAALDTAMIFLHEVNYAIDPESNGTIEDLSHEELLRVMRVVDRMREQLPVVETVTASGANGSDRENVLADNPGS